MPTTQILMIKGDRISSNTDYRDALPVNMYGVKRDILGAQGYMLCYPGLTQFTTGAGIDRGGVYNDRFGSHFRVSGTSLIRVNDGAAIDTIGTISGTGQVSMPYSFTTQCVIADKKMFLYNSTDGFIQVTDPDILKPIDCVWIDGYYFLTDGDYIYHTKLSPTVAGDNPELEIDPSSYASAEFMPDPIMGL